MRHTPGVRAQTLLFYTVTYSEGNRLGVFLGEKGIREEGEEE